MTTVFRHDPDIISEFPTLHAGIMVVRRCRGLDRQTLAPEEAEAKALDRLAQGTEAEFPEIKAWRAAFSQMGLKPTQYRCASEALLRRLRREGHLPRVQPFVDFCNANSAAAAIPVAAYDLDRIAGDLVVRRATGTERYLTFGGTEEYPAPDEVIFADEDGRAHARRWTNRQSGYSAVSQSTDNVLIVAEAMHASAAADVESLLLGLRDRLGKAGADLETMPWPPGVRAE